MRLPHAATALQVHRRLHLQSLVVIDRIACFVSPAINAESLPAGVKHRRHERQPIELPPLVEGGKDLLLAADFHPFTGS